MFKKKNAPAGNGEADIEQVDEELFNALKRQKKKKRRKRITILIIVLILLGVGSYFGVKLLQKQVKEQFAAETQEILSAEAEIGSISTTVSGSGMLVNVDTETVSVPSGVTVTEILVKYGDTVSEGDMLASVDMATVRSAMSSLQDEIDSLDSQIASAKGDSVSTYVTAGVSGRVKLIYAAKGDKVENVMIEKGSLALISLDGYMAVDINTSQLTKGESVTVTLSDGKTVKGTVETAVGGSATVILSDNGPAYDDTVTVTNAEDKLIGTGRLYIHNPLAVTGYAGTISAVNVSLNQTVYSTTYVFTLKDTSTSAAYNALLRQRSEYEKTLLELLKIQRDGSIVSPISGGIYSVATLSDDSSETVTDLVTISPDKQMQVTITVDESDILSIEPGQKVNVTVRSVSSDTIEGVVEEIDNTYSNSKYTALITIPKSEGMIAGMTARVNIIIEGVDDAILIPVEALHQTSKGYYVYTGYDEENGEYTGKVDVIPGMSNSSYVEIKSGLSVGDTVYYTEEQQEFSFPFSFGDNNGGNGGNNGGGGEASSGGGNSDNGGGPSSGGNPGGNNGGGGEASSGNRG